LFLTRGPVRRARLRRPSMSASPTPTVRIFTSRRTVERHGPRCPVNSIARSRERRPPAASVAPTAPHGPLAPAQDSIPAQVFSPTVPCSPQTACSMSLIVTAPDLTTAPSETFSNTTRQPARGLMLLRCFPPRPVMPTTSVTAVWLSTNRFPPRSWFQPSIRGGPIRSGCRQTGSHHDHGFSLQFVVARYHSLAQHQLRRDLVADLELDELSQPQLFLHTE